MLKRWVSLLLAIIMILAAIPAFNIYAETTSYYRLNQTYEHLNTTSDFNADLNNLGASYVSADSKIKVVGSDLSLLGKRSLAINRCDMRWWQLSIADEKMYIDLSVRADENFNNNLNIYFTSKQPSLNEVAYSGSIAFSVEKADDKIILFDCNGKEVTQLTENIRCAIRCEFSRGSDIYNIYVDNILKASNIKMATGVYSIEDLHIYVNSLDNDANDYLRESYILIDSPAVFAEGKKYPQKFSAQSLGNVPDIQINDNLNNEDIKVFVNEIELAMANPPVEKNNTVYIDLEQLSRCIGMILDENKATNSFVLYNENVSVKASLGSKNVIINDIEYSIAYAPEKINKVIAVTPNFISEALNAKVWWDYEGKMLVITTGQYKKDDILKNVGGKLYMNGEPYYEISFNKFDLFYQILADYMPNTAYPSEEYTYKAAEAALKQLNELGFKSIRVFAFSNEFSDLMYNEEHQRIYFEAMDKFMDLCDKYDIKVVFCMGLIESFLLKNDYYEGKGFVTSTETTMDIVADPKCESRQNVYKYIEMVVNRYKDRKTILMWEIKNEGNLEADVGAAVNKQSYSLLQLAEFYGACADKIKEFDKEHLITSGDSILRSSQWNLLNDVLQLKDLSWKTDTKEERLKALYLLNENIDVISTHAYGLGISNESGFADSEGNFNKCDFKLYLQEAEILGKPLYNGETNGSFDFSDENFYSDTKVYLNSIIESGVQLSHWWTFRSDRQGFNDGYLWRIDSGELLAMIVEANRMLKNKYCINKAENENTTDAWQDPDFQVLDISKITNGEEFAVMASLNSKLLRFATISCVMFFVIIVLVIFLTREKLKRKRTDDFV